MQQLMPRFSGRVRNPGQLEVDLENTLSCNTWLYNTF